MEVICQAAGVPHGAPREHFERGREGVLGRGLDCPGGESRKSWREEAGEKGQLHLGEGGIPL